MKELLLDRLDSPLGQILIVFDDPELCALDYADYETRMLKLLRARYGEVQLKEVSNPEGFRSLLQEYFRGNFRALDNILVNTGGSAFQQEVWKALRTIPAGSVVSYGELARKIGKPGYARAVGLANSLNPIAIVIPCHRVVGANTNLTGYAGGLERKRWLLEHEGAISPIKKNVEQLSFEL